MTTTITRQRVTLRPSTWEDIPRRVGWLNDPEVTEFTGTEAGETTIELAKRRQAERTWPDWIIEVKGRPIGCCTLCLDDAGQEASFGIVIGEKDCWDKGYGAAALREALRVGFEELGLHRVHLEVFLGNTRGIRCYEKCGFRREGLHLKARWKRGRWQDMVSMAILREEWTRLSQM